MNLEDTIAAISTPLGEGGIGIVRLSGPGAFRIAGVIFEPDAGCVDEFASHRAHLGRVRDSHSGEALDRALLTLFISPKSYTGEDIAELSCHGGSYLLSRVLEAALASGARLAGPGEFTLRAFLHGRLDLAQAEAVLDLIKARADASLRLAESQLEGTLSREVSDARAPLISLLARIEAATDFPDDVDEPETNDVQAALISGAARVEALLATAQQGIICREGAGVVIAGRPNVGKSSVMNALLREARAIVTPVSGTTRDVLEESASIRGIPIRAIDTAGLRNPRGQVEALGIERARRKISSADLLILVVDGSRRLSSRDAETLAEVASRRLVVALNKIDLPTRTSAQDVLRALGDAGNAEAPVIPLCAITGEGLSALEDALVKELTGKDGVTPDSAVVTNVRHRDALRRASDSLRQALDAAESRTPLDLLSVDLTAALQALGEITGHTVHEDLLEQIFAQFCIGK